MQLLCSRCLPCTGPGDGLINVLPVCVCVCVCVCVNVMFET